MASGKSVGHSQGSTLLPSTAVRMVNRRLETLLLVCAVTAVSATAQAQDGGTTLYYPGNSPPPGYAATSKGFIWAACQYSVPRSYPEI